MLKFSFIYVMYISNTSPIIGTIGNLMRIRDTSAEWTWLGLEWYPA